MPERASHGERTPRISRLASSGRTWGLWPDERFVDYRRLEVIGPIMEARLDRCRDAGFDAVEPDAIDSFTEPTGLGLRQADARRYLEWLIDQAHSRGMSIALKNTPQRSSCVSQRQ